MGMDLQSYYRSVRNDEGYVNIRYVMNLNHSIELPEEITRYTGYQFFNTKKRDIVIKMMAWCDDNINGIYDVMMNSIVFQFEEDAMAFKLMWS